jgi:hypothetical protein
MAKWIRARQYYTMEDIAAKIAQHQAAQQQVQALAQLAQALAVAVA